MAGSLGFPESPVVAEVGIGLAVAAALVLTRKRAARPLLLATGVVALLVIPHFLVAWHGDALETDRHSLAAAVQLRVVLWVVAALALDAALSRSGNAGRTPRR